MPGLLNHPTGQPGAGQGSVGATRVAAALSRFIFTMPLQNTSVRGPRPRIPAWKSLQIRTECDRQRVTAIMITISEAMQLEWRPWKQLLAVSRPGELPSAVISTFHTACKTPAAASVRRPRRRIPAMKTLSITEFDQAESGREVTSTFPVAKVKLGSQK